MSFCTRRFNLYFVPVMVGLLVSGCALWHHEKKGPTAALRVHGEANATTSSSSKTISIMRSQPVELTISEDPILTEADVVSARVIDSPGGGFAVQVQFESTPGWQLEEFTAGNPGKHLAIFGQWSEKPSDGRWLAAPLITHRIADAKLVFTPDASREEADQLVKGLNQAHGKNASLKSDK
jgi:preprotein translocase subunit SecD